MMTIITATDCGVAGRQRPVTMTVRTVSVAVVSLECASSVNDVCVCNFRRAEGFLPSSQMTRSLSLLQRATDPLFDSEFVDAMHVFRLEPFFAIVCRRSRFRGSCVSLSPFR